MLLGSDDKIVRKLLYLTEKTKFQNYTANSYQPGLVSFKNIVPISRKVINYEGLLLSNF